MTLKDNLNPAKLFAKGGALERGCIPGVIWVGVLSLAFDHILCPLLSVRWPGIRVIPLPAEYWDALPWIVGAVLGKKVGDKYISSQGGKGETADGDRDKPQA